MIINFKKHNNEFYNTLLILSRNIYFYKDLNLKDTFETRLYLMFLHFSIILIIFKKKKVKFDQKKYDIFFSNIEGNLRESGLGDVTVNKKMKDLNKLFYDILLKLEDKNSNYFKINKKLVQNYFSEFDDKNNSKYQDFERYFDNFYKFCFEQSTDNVIRKAINFKYTYGST